MMMKSSSLAVAVILLTSDTASNENFVDISISVHESSSQLYIIKTHFHSIILYPVTWS